MTGATTTGRGPRAQHGRARALDGGGGDFPGSLALRGLHGARALRPRLERGAPPAPREPRRGGAGCATCSSPSSSSRCSAVSIDVRVLLPASSGRLLRGGPRPAEPWSAYGFGNRSSTWPSCRCQDRCWACLRTNQRGPPSGASRATRTGTGRSTGGTTTAGGVLDDATAKVAPVEGRHRRPTAVARRRGLIPSTGTPLFGSCTGAWCYDATRALTVLALRRDIFASASRPWPTPTRPRRAPRRTADERLARGARFYLRTKIAEALNCSRTRALNAEVARPLRELGYVRRHPCGNQPARRRVHLISRR